MFDLPRRFDLVVDENVNVGVFFIICWHAIVVRAKWFWN